ncbi:MAG: PAS domain S-box [Solidesulfovibrio magneticus str. Maddingley MBC34]|uniref:histidine kinase n=1 Tax=Solidesulfovibrio magneticus str. Maddingley MBC34 TaxID=1206767 RepID=K6GNU9_9BACT|nr:MAG: PAS domain S-box [Solidesulfovibrio magneticus str. Maddingley MBC34]
MVNPARTMSGRLFSRSVATLLVAVALLAALPATLAFIWTSIEARGRAEAEVTADLVTLTRSLAAVQEAINRQALGMLETLRATRSVTNRELDSANRLFAAILAGRPELSNIFLTDAAGRVIASGVKPFADLSDRKYFRDAAASKQPGIGEFILGRATGKPILVYALPLLDDHDEFSGILALAYFLDGYERFVAGLDMPPHVRVTLLDPSGRRMVAYPPNPIYPLGEPAFAPIWDHVRDAASDALTFTSARPTGQVALLSSLRLRQFPDAPPYMTIILSSARDEAFAEADLLLRRGLILAAVAVLLALALGRLAGRAAIGRGIESLDRAAAALAGGDLSARAAVDGGAAEVRRLGESFNTMAGTIEIRQQELANAAKAMEKLRGQLSNILESMPSAIIGLDAAGRVTHLNAQAATLFGLSRETVMGREAALAVPFLAGHMDAMEDALRQRRSLLLERMPLRRGDDDRLMNMLFYPLVANGAEGVVIRLDDVTERERLRELMIQTEKMMSVGGLAAGMAHEINNPLGSILQAAQVVELQLDPALPANQEAARKLGLDLADVRAYLEARKVLKFLAGIREAGLRAASIVASMLEFSRQSDSRHVQADLRAMADKSLSLAESDYDLKKRYDFKHITIERDYPDKPVTVSCAPTEIEQVLLNLLKNAAHALAGAAHENKTPTITVRVRALPEAGEIVVADNGPGMDEATRARVFEPFFTTKPAGEGTGLGLSVSYFIIVNNHGGGVRMDAEPGAGTRCTITLPRREKA